MYSISVISPQTTDLHRHQRPGQRRDAPYLDAPQPDEEKRLNFKLKELIDYAGRIMELTDKDEHRKWKGIEGLMKRMQADFPYLINADTCLELCFEDTLFGEPYEYQGPLSYSQFVEALGSRELMESHHAYIASHYGPIGNADNRRETLRAEDKLLMLYSALRYELEHHEGYLALFDDDAPQKPAAQVVPMPHFGMENSERAQKHWEAVYEWLANANYIRRNEVDYHGWVYACCGQQLPPGGPIVWHGSVAALAHIIRTKFNGQWDKAEKIFCLESGKTFPVSFNTTHKPVDKVVKSIDRGFITANSH